MKISIITASYNSSKTIEDCINSVLNQTSQNIEHIIVDGQSTDGTIDIIKSYANRVAQIIIEPDMGIYDALNKGIKKSKGSIIGFLHADDLLFSRNTIENIEHIFIKNDMISAVYGDLHYVNRENTSKIVRKWKANSFIKKKLYLGWMPPHPTLYVKKDWYSSINYFDLKYKISADYDSIIKMFSHIKFISYYYPEVFVKMRIGGISNKSVHSIIVKTFEDYQIITKLGLPLPKTLFALISKNISKLKQFF